jgi:hypothetical protein
MAEASGMYVPSEADEIAVQFAKAEKVVSKAHGTTKPGGGVGGRRMGQPVPRPPTPSKPAPSPKPASSPKREPPKKRSSEEELEAKRRQIRRDYTADKALCFLAEAPERLDNFRKIRDLRLWEAQVEYDERKGTKTAGPRPPVPSIEGPLRVPWSGSPPTQSSPQ